MSIRKGFAEAACVKASEARNFRKSRRLGSLMKSPLYLSFQRLDAHDVSVVVNVPDANRICRIIDPCSSIVRIGFGHLVFDPSLSPRIERWIEYEMPEPYSHDRRTWIDNSTDPISVWYVDHNGYIVRIQPLE